LFVLFSVLYSLNSVEGPRYLLRRLLNLSETGAFVLFVSHLFLEELPAFDQVRLGHSPKVLVLEAKTPSLGLIFSIRLARGSLGGRGVVCLGKPVVLLKLL